MTFRPPRIPRAPRAIQKGTSLKSLLDKEAIDCLARNIQYVYKYFDTQAFSNVALADIAGLGLMQRGQHIAGALYQFLPGNYSEAMTILISSLTPERTEADEFGLSEFFYLPHSFFISEYGQNSEYNGGDDPYEMSMQALRALTTRFTSEFAIRPFLLRQPERTLATIAEWLKDPNPHVRRLCSEGTRPRLPWGKRITSFVANPKPTFFILNELKTDNSLYVRRSVANHLGDVAKDHLNTVCSICESWLETAPSNEIKWIVRHALRHPAKKGNPKAVEIRARAK